MKLAKLKSICSLSIMVGLVVACGGGGDDEAGAPVALNIQPTTLTVTASAVTAGGPPAGFCSAGDVGLVYIFGGAAPYSVKNTSPDVVSIDRTEVGKNESFKVTYLGSPTDPTIGGCFSPVLIVVVDKLNNQVTLTLNNKPAS